MLSKTEASDPILLVEEIANFKKAEDALVQAQGKLAHLLSSSPAVIYSFDATGDNKPSFISDNFTEILGYERDEYLENPKFVEQCLHPDDADRITEMMPRLWEEGRLTKEYRFRLKDGSYTWVNDDMKLVLDENGNPREVVGSWSIVAERKEAELALVQAQDRLEHIMSSSPSVVYSFEATGDYKPTYISRNVKDLLGYEPYEYLKITDFWKNKLHPDDMERVLNTLPRLWKEGRLSQDYRIQRKDKSYCWINDELVLRKDENGEPLEAIGSWSDITAKTQVGEALVTAQNRLSHLISFTPAVIYSFDIKGNNNATFVSENITELLGYEPREYLDDRNFWVERLHPDDKKRVIKEFTNVWETGRLEQEYRFRKKDGNYLWVNDQLRVVKNESDEIKEIVGAWTDIDRRKQAEEALVIAKEQADQLLLNVLPVSIANRLKNDNKIIADKYAEATILFLDIVGFTEFSSKLLPSTLVSVLNDIFIRLDSITEKNNLEKIKTIGDSYLLAGGLPDERDDHAEVVAIAALEMRAEIEKLNREIDENIKVRIGIHSGPVVAGVIGKNKFTYDIWGDTVNIASRLESHSETGKIQVSEVTYYMIKDKFKFEERGLVDLKGKGKLKTYYLIDNK